MYEELDEWYEDEMREKREWMLAAMEYQDKLRELRDENEKLKSQLADIAERLDEELEICLPK